METMPVSVVIADDHEIVRQGLRALLNVPEIRIVGEAATGNEAVAAAIRLKPEVILLDVRMPEMDGIQALKAIKSSCPKTAVLMLTQFEDRDYIESSILSGAAGYILKRVSGQELVQIIWGIAREQVSPNTDALHTLLARLHRELAGGSEMVAGRAEAVGLTQRERAVLGLLAEGLSNREIALKLGIEPNTVKTHLMHLFDKLDVSDRTQAALWAARRGLK